MRLAMPEVLSEISLAKIGLAKFKSKPAGIALPGPSIKAAISTMPVDQQLGLPGQSDTSVPVRRETPDQSKVLALYRSVLGQLDDAKQNYAVGLRIAELEMQQAQLALEENAGTSAYKAAIQDLEGLLLPTSLILSSTGASNMASAKTMQPLADQVMIHYQLAHAYDQSRALKQSVYHLDRTIELGDTVQGVAAIVMEARFRRAEINFSEQDYLTAAVDYQTVAEAPGQYQIHALYMLSWAFFKEGELQSSFDALLTAMHNLLHDNSIEKLEPSQQEFVNDLVRLAMITLNYLDGVETLSLSMQKLHKPEWQIHLYAALADWYQDKGRLQDSAGSWLKFVDENPLAKEAPGIALAVMNIYQEAGFDSEIAPGRLEFIDRYAKNSEFYAIHGDAVFDTYRADLVEFMTEQTTNAHAQAQTSGLIAEYLIAAGWYRKWLLNFDATLVGATTNNGQPGNAKADIYAEDIEKMSFLLAESLFDGGETLAAVNAFQRVAERFLFSDRGKEAAYAAILGLASLADEAIENNLVLSYRQRKILASEFFINHYPMDSRTDRIRLNAANMLFEQQQFELANTLVLPLVNQGVEKIPNNETAAELWSAAILIAAHSQFALGDYALAEASYRRSLAAHKNDKKVLGKLLAAVFKQAEIAEAADEYLQSINHLRRLSEIDASSQLAIDARYDIAQLYIKAGRYQEAAMQLEGFRKSFRHHPATINIANQLVELYELHGSIDMAATELLSISEDVKETPAARRKALFRAGELYLKIENITAAINSFRQYAHQYPAPFEIRMEAMQHMDLLYQLTGEKQKQRYWMKKKVSVYAAASPAELNPRVRYLAAQAAFTLSQDKLDEFNDAALALPLKRSLKIKRHLMQQTLSVFQQVGEYGVAEFISAATYKTGAIYEALAESILQSERPTELNPLELAQYNILLEEQAFPFEEQAIDIYAANISRAWKQGWDQWIDVSLERLEHLSPGEYKRQSSGVAYVERLY